jgi:hypothetical protein
MCRHHMCRHHMYSCAFAIACALTLYACRLFYRPFLIVSRFLSGCVAIVDSGNADISVPGAIYEHVLREVTKNHECNGKTLPHTATAIRPPHPTTAVRYNSILPPQNSLLLSPQLCLSPLIFRSLHTSFFHTFPPHLPSTPSLHTFPPHLLQAPYARIASSTSSRLSPSPRPLGPDPPQASRYSQ